MHDKLRPHVLCVFGIYGKEPKLETFGVLLCRGSDLPVPLVKEHPSFEYWKKRKLDVKNKKDLKLIINYFTTKEGSVEGREVQNHILYK